jgi:hypothetical protein
MLEYIGPRLSTGEPANSFNHDGLPAGDLDETTMTEKQIKKVLASGLYREAKSPKKAAETAVKD